MLRVAARLPPNMPWKKPVAMGSAHIIANIKVVNLLLQVERAMPT
jgi:hypothetical protein